MPEYYYVIARDAENRFYSFKFEHNVKSARDATKFLTMFDAASGFLAFVNRWPDRTTSDYRIVKIKKRAKCKECGR